MLPATGSACGRRAASGDERRTPARAGRRLCAGLLPALCVLLAGCTVRAAALRDAAPPAAREAGNAAPAIRFTVLHVNDVYEITGSTAGWGGPARLATLRRHLLAANPNVITVLAGDLLSPSALGTARVDGQRLDGRQMVDVLNVVGIDYVTFGNHEFDLSERVLLDRIRESRFRWVSVNVRAANGQALPGVVPHVIVRIGEGRDTVRVAVTGVTTDRDVPAYARIAEPVAAGTAAARLLRDSADIILALTHLPSAQDVRLAQSAPQIDLIAGGHDHDNVLLYRGEGPTPIAKADANVRTAWVHDVTWDVRQRKASVQSRLVSLDASVPEDSATLATAWSWVERAYRAFGETGFEPAAIVADVPIPLDGLESSVLRDTTALSRAIAEAMRAEARTDVALYNAGAIRIDDVLRPGPLTQYDVIRILPFGGPVVEVEMRGTVLRRVLEQGVRNRGTGGFLQYAGIERGQGDGWQVAGGALDDARTYRLAISDFLLTGREQGMDWLTRASPELRVVREHRDVRFALIDELARRYRR